MRVDLPQGRRNGKVVWRQGLVEDGGRDKKGKIFDSYCIIAFAWNALWIDQKQILHKDSSAIFFLPYRLAEGNIHLLMDERLMSYITTCDVNINAAVFG